MARFLIAGDRRSRPVRLKAPPAVLISAMSNTLIQPKPRCFYCDLVLDEEEARIDISNGKIFGPCCSDAVAAALREMAIA